jgi:hypothetical protein
MKRQVDNFAHVACVCAFKISAINSHCFYKVGASNGEVAYGVRIREKCFLKLLRWTLEAYVNSDS